MRILRYLMAVWVTALMPVGAAAQERVWLQIEARPSLALATERAASYAGQLPDVNGFRLRSGWYAISLGPYSRSEAESRLSQLRFARAIPSDSFVADGQQYLQRFFGAAEAAAAAPSEPLVPLRPGEETVEEAQLGERSLTREDRELVQIALRWEGFYDSAIDASFGPGTRRAMAAWQADRRFEPTGVLTTRQRQDLVQGYRAALRALDLQPVVDTTAGVTIDMPSALVAFDRYEPPFAQYNSATDDGVRVLLISQEGDANRLAALYDVMQTLEIVPVDGSRALRRSDFTLTGENDRIHSHTYARLDRGEIKGFTLVWPAGDEKRRRLALEAMQASFATLDGVLPDTLGSETQDIDLLAGLEIRRPERSRSGFFVTSDGGVLTTAEAVGQCGRVTLGDDVDADVAASDPARGLALLRPRTALAPLAVARLAGEEPRLQSEIAVSGYSFGGILGAPSLTFGTVADVRGLDGNPDVQRLAVMSEPGDAGGPVFDAAGTVAGMLLGAEDGARQLPEDVAFAVDAAVLSAFLSENGLTAAGGGGAEDMAPEDLTLLAADMTVLVNCWN